MKGNNLWEAHVLTIRLERLLENELSESSIKSIEEVAGVIRDMGFEIGFSHLRNEDLERQIGLAIGFAERSIHTIESCRTRTVSTEVVTALDEAIAYLRGSLDIFRVQAEHAHELPVVSRLF